MKLNSIKKKEYCLLSAMLLAAFLVMFCLTTLTPMVADDYDYSYSMSTGLRVDSLYEIRQTIRMHWKGLNGRFFSHIFAYYFLWQPKALFNFANALVAAVLVLFAYRSIRLVSPSRAFFYTVAWCMLVFCFIPVFGQVFLWLDGACNYSWGLAWNLIYLFLFSPSGSISGPGGTFSQSFCFWQTPFSQGLTMRRSLFLFSALLFSFSWSVP